MAEVLPLRALRYDPAAVGSLDRVIAPPYDVIDSELRARLLAQSDRNVVEIDLPEAGGDPYEHAASTLAAWKADGTLITDPGPAFWVVQQDYAAPDGTQRTRRGFFARVRVEEYGPGRIRPHERTHPGPKEDRLRLTRATKANLSPIFSLFADPDHGGQEIIDRATETPPIAAIQDLDNTTNTLWRVDDAETITALEHALADEELLIADGHHRYETARVYADEIGGEGGHRYVLMFLCSLADPGLLVFPTHRLLTGLRDDTAKQQALRTTITENFDLERLDDPRHLEPTTQDATVRLGYLDHFHNQPYALTLKDQSITDKALQGKPEPYRRLDTAVLEALVLKHALQMTEDHISHLHGLAYSKDFDDALDAVQSGRADAGFFMRATPVEQVQAIAATGESMPPKSTYFYPKVPTGLVFNEL